MILTKLAVPVGPVLAGFGVVGIAVGFGAQHLIRDLISGIFVIAENQFHGLIGPNGSGKSTLLKCIAGAETVSAGEIHFLGSNITGRSATDRARSGMSLKFQITSVFDTLSVYDNVLLSLQAEGTPWQLMRSHTRKDLDSAIYKPYVLESKFREIINPRKKNIIVGCIYRHPSMDLNEFNENYLHPLLEKLSVSTRRF